MYDELIKALHEGAEFLECSTPGIKNSFAKMCHDAADAIEELSRAADAIPHVCECCIGCEVESGGGCDSAFVLSPKRAREYLNKLRWIPVTERLPEKNGSYLVYVYGEVTEMNCWHGKWHRLGDDYTKAVTHWMPLPSTEGLNET